MSQHVKHVFIDYNEIIVIQLDFKWFRFDLNSKYFAKNQKYLQSIQDDQ